MRRLLSTTTPPLLLFCFLLTILLSACQNKPLDQAQACNPRSRPSIKALEPVSPSSQSVYITSGQNLYKLNAGNGTMYWCSNIVADHQQDRFASLTRRGNMLYTFTELGMITAFDTTSGKLVWSSNTGNIYTDVGSKALPPSVVNGIIYGGNSTISALSTQDGSIRWQYPLPAHVFTNTVPLTTNGNVFVSTKIVSQDESEKRPDQLLALDAATGNKRWAISLGEKHLWQDLTVGEGVVIFQYHTLLDGGDREGIGVIDAQNGKLLWQKDLDVFTPMSIAHGLLYILAEIPSNRTDAIKGLYTFDLRTGAARQVLTQDVGIDDPFIIANNALYTANRAGEVRAIDAFTGKFLWHAQLGIHTKFAQQVRMILRDQELFVGTEIFEDTIDHGKASLNEKFFLHTVNISTHKEGWFADITGAESLNITGMDIGI